MKKLNNIFIADEVIANLADSNKISPKKLIEHLHALNTAYDNSHFPNCAILIRAILDYIPTIYGYRNIGELLSQVKAKQTFKIALKEIDQAMRHVADDVLHNPANKIEFIKVKSATISNQFSNLIIVLENVIRQLKYDDLRDEGNKLINDYRNKKATSYAPKSHLDLFKKYFSEKDSWYIEFIDNKKVWIYKKDNLYQIHERDDYEDFSESWTKVYPDSLGSGKHSIDIIYNNNLIKRFTFIYCDGGRISVVIPEMEIDKNNTTFYWIKNSIDVIITELVGSFYIYKNIKGIANMSKIEIR